MLYFCPTLLMQHFFPVQCRRAIIFLVTMRKGNTFFQPPCRRATLFSGLNAQVQHFFLTRMQKGNIFFQVIVVRDKTSLRPLMQKGNIFLKPSCSKPMLFFCLNLLMHHFVSVQCKKTTLFSSSAIYKCNTFFFKKKPRKVNLFFWSQCRGTTFFPATMQKNNTIFQQQCRRITLFSSNNAEGSHYFPATMQRDNTFFSQPQCRWVTLFTGHNVKGQQFFPA